MANVNVLVKSDTFGKWFERINELITNYNSTDDLNNIINEIITQAQNRGQIGDYIQTGTAGDYSTYTKNGVYHLSASGTTNYPLENVEFNLYVAAQENSITQLAISIETKDPKLYFRSKLSKDSSWTSWVKLLSDKEAKATYLPLAGGTIDHITVTNNLNVNGEITSKGSITTEDDLIFDGPTTDVTLSSTGTDFTISVPDVGNENPNLKIDAFKLDFETNEASINGLAERANKLTYKGLTNDYTKSDEELAASGKAVYDLYQYSIKEFVKSNGATFTGAVEFKENIILNDVIYSPTDISFRPTDAVQIVSNSNFSELYLDKDNEPVVEHPHVLGTRRRSGITNYNIGSIVYDTSCIEIGEDAINLRLRKINSSTLEEEQDDVSFSFTGTEVKPNVDNSISLGSPSFKFSQIYASSDTINTSDRNLKDDIKTIDENLIENWCNVQWCSFKFKDSIIEKGEDARIHTGLIAQDLYNTLEDYNIDASKYGFFCHDTWDDQYDTQYVTLTQEDEEGNITETKKEIKTLIKEAGEQYSLRYTEIQAIENAYLRNEIKKLKTEIEALKASITELQPKTDK